MKIIITGSLGHIGKPLTQELVQKGHEVTVISSRPEKKKDIEALGATAAVGSLEEVSFLSSTFTGADAVYCMVPPTSYHSTNIDPFAYYHTIGTNYAHAIAQAGVKRVVHLSSIGAHLPEGTGLLVAHHDVENILKALPGIAITHMRPAAFYYNLFGFVAMIKNTGGIAANYGGEDKVVWVSPLDIAAAIAEELVTPGEGRSIRYVASDELTCSETARILGLAIGKPEMQWITISKEQMQRGMQDAGMPAKIAAGLAEMNVGMHSGTIFQDYYQHRPRVMGKIKMTTFANEFAAAFK